MSMQNIEPVFDDKGLRNALSGMENTKYVIIFTVMNIDFINNGLADTLLDFFGSNRSVVICQNLTHPSENIIKTDLKNINQHLRNNLNTLAVYPTLF